MKRAKFDMFAVDRIDDAPFDLIERVEDQTISVLLPELD